MRLQRYIFFGTQITQILRISADFLIICENQGNLRYLRAKNFISLCPQKSIIMFEKVNLVKKANIYFDGKVTSRTIFYPCGTRKTLGIMLPGEYEFGTDAPELMEIQAGTVEILLPNETEWRTVTAGGSFEVPGKSKFQIKMNEVVDYICSYLN